jgi:hypothetical protein
MKKIIVLTAFLGFVLILQGCAIYPPFGHRAVYNSYNYGGDRNGNRGWGGHHGGGGGQNWNGGGNGWRGGHGHH